MSEKKGTKKYNNRNNNNDDDSMPRQRKMKKKVCMFCADKALVIDYKEADKLKNEERILELKRKKYTLKQISEKLNLSIDYVKKVSRKGNQ